ncbi:cMP-N-acetylneuraminic acid synthetase NeuA2 [Clostridium sp. CAG:253]|nr:cMP-N-acetylneuraminic acid synthetase NeuA2 [Clostridium sp. CAG:253]
MLEVCGKPIIAYSIEAALKSEIFDEIMVSTDDEKIKNIAVEYGAKVPFMRSEKTSNDYAATHEVLLEVLDDYKKRDIYFENICCIYPTAPFVTQHRLKEAYVLLEKQNVDSVVTVTAFSFPPQRALLYKDSFLKY